MLATRDVYWIGGGSGAGKSTIARRLADRHGLRCVSTDDAMADHARRSTAEDAPLLHEFMAMNMDERWVERSPAVMLDTFHWFRGEGFERILEDLREAAEGTGVIVEGFRLLPRLVKPLLARTSHAVWLLPTPEFRRTVFDARGPEWGFLASTRDPARALANLLERDRRFTNRLREETQRLGLRAIEVDGALSEAELTERVAEAFGL